MALDYEWNCPSCTFINRAGSYKCSICGTPKGTSTRQVKFCLSSIEQQYAAENFQTLSRHHTTKSSKLCNLGNSVGKRKKDQSNVSYKRKYLDLCSFAWHDKGKMMVPEHRLTETEDVEVAAKAESLCSLDVDEETSSAFRDLHQHSLWPRLTKIDRSLQLCRSVSVNSVSVVIKEYVSIEV